MISTDPDRIAKDADERLTRGEVERIGGEAIVTIRNHGGERQKATLAISESVRLNIGAVDSHAA